MHVLFVDDNPLMQQVISRFLVSQGYSVAVADSAEQALNLSRQERYHLVVIDMRLPDRDGPDLLKALRQEPGMACCPAIAVSGLGEDDRERTVAAGFDAFLSKPIDLDELLAAVQRYVPVDRARVLGI
ncbi:MAG: response regulator [Oscillochloridaceae bacterium]|nr:response regulator [Chloroflexaceae bacterium]MDW8390573.1 response regulator [Oscillochloridaceae bacterium]